MMWVDAEANLARFNNRDSIDKYVDLVADLGFTHLAVDARPITGELLYDSDLAPRFEGVRRHVDIDRSFDYLGRFVERAHARGMKVLFSLNTFCAGNNYVDRGLVYDGHPQWASIVQDPELGLIPITQQKGKYSAMVNPANPEYQSYIIEVIKDMLSHYPEVDGLILDRGRYDGISADFSELSRTKFEEFIGKKIKKFPDDILKITRIDGKDKVIKGKYYKDWIYWRSKTIRDFFARARREFKSVAPDKIFSTYSGAWYPSYYEVGVNFASNKYDPSKDFEWAREDYKDTGYAELIDMYITGNYYTDITIDDYLKRNGLVRNETDFEGHSGDWYCVEGSCRHLRQILGDNKFLGGLLVDQLYGDVDRIPQAIAMNLKESDGLMIFDIVHIINRNLWDKIRQGMILGGAIPDSRPASMDIIPAPSSVEPQADAAPFILDDNTTLNAPQFEKEAGIISGYITRLTGITTSVAPPAETAGENCIDFITDPSIGGSDAFKITVTSRGITVAGGSSDGLFLGAMTLVKAIGAGSAASVVIPAGTIKGNPAFGYRGAHFDVCRHFFGMEDVKAFIDMMALHGLNRFHWHLSDDQGWRIEIKSYPRLTEKGSRRDSTVIGRNSGVWDHTPVEGFFTQDQARQIVSYAADRHIQVIPEIDMPGHMRAALASYPDLGCTGGPYSVWTEWGVTEEVLCPGNQTTMDFITGVLDEIMDIFPSDIIHIGGDECPKDRWKNCPRCQALIKKLKIKPSGRFSAEDRLQGYVTRHAAEVCARRGRRIIGWDEILQSDIPADAIVMSWQGTDGGREGIRRGHDVILSPNSCMYFDFYQTKDVEHEPFAIGGFSPVEKVYAFDPWDIAGNGTGRLLGVQANLWTEYIPSFSHVQYMELPRMAALAEVQWGEPGTKDWQSFKNRIPAMLAIYERLGWNYARHITDPAVTYTPVPDTASLTVTLDGLRDSEIRYTTDGSEPTAVSPLYTGQLSITEPTVLHFASFRDGRRGRVLSDTINVNKATFRRTVLNTAAAPGYGFNGAQTLVDGIRGTSNYRTGRWIGFYSEPFDATVDLGASTTVNSVGFDACVFSCDGVVDAADATVMLSDDGKNFSTAARWTNDGPEPDDEFTVKSHTIPLPAAGTARYVRLVVNPVASLPSWHPLAGSRAFIFIDEISVD